MWKNSSNPKVIAAICVLSCYFCMVNVNLSRRARAIEIERERKLSLDLGNNECLLTPPTTVVASPESTKTLLASYPGSGKRFVYQIIEGLTDCAPGDDHNFSQNDQNTLHIKTSYPHHEGIWSWGSKMDQMILLMRNPRWALPSYHNLKFELDFSTNWVDSYARIPYVYTVRPIVSDWLQWRDVNFEDEMQNWVDFIVFWMEGGTSDVHCSANEMDCLPKTILDFDVFYQEHTTSEFAKLGTVLDASPNVEVIGRQARACILDAIFDNASNPPAAVHKVFHNSNRNGNGDAPATKRFTSPQLTTMYEAVQGLVYKYSTPTWSADPIAIELVIMLKEYARQIDFEHDFQQDMEQ